jgi:hypothetical protein
MLALCENLYRSPVCVFVQVVHKAGLGAKGNAATWPLPFTQRLRLHARDQVCSEGNKRCAVDVGVPHLGDVVVLDRIRTPALERPIAFSFVSRYLSIAFARVRSREGLTSAAPGFFRAVSRDLIHAPAADRREKVSLPRWLTPFRIRANANKLHHKHDIKSPNNDR